MTPKNTSLIPLLAVALGLTASAAHSQTHELKRAVPTLVVTQPATPDAPVVTPAVPPAAQAQVSTSNLTFGNTDVGGSRSSQVLFQNTGTAVLTLSPPSISGAAYSATTSCGTSLASGGSCLVTVVFAPTSAGSFNGSLVLASSAANSPHTVALSGVGTVSVTATGALSGDGDFGTLYIGQPVTRTFNFTNSGAGSAENVMASVTGTGVSIYGGTCGTVGNPNTVFAGGSCSITLRWNPSSAMSMTGQLTVTSSADNSPSTAVLSGVSQVDNAFYANGKTFIYAGDMNYASAVASCQDRTDRGYSDWRVPTLAELKTLPGVVGGYSGLSGRGWPSSDRCYWSTDVYNANYQKGNTLATNSSCTNYKQFSFLTTCVR